MSAAVDRITFVGHATVLIEVAGVRLLTDPVLGSRLLHIRRWSAAPAAEVTERLDAVLISHLHHDHLDFGSLRRLDQACRSSSTRRRQGTSPPRIRRRDRARALGRAPGSARPRIHRHPGRSTAADTRSGPRSRPSASTFRAERRRVYFAGDTDLFDGMKELAEGLGVALLPISGWGPRLGRGHLDPSSAASAAAILRPAVAIPIHWEPCSGSASAVAVPSSSTLPCASSPRSPSAHPRSPSRCSIPVVARARPALGSRAPAGADLDQRERSPLGSDQSHRAHRRAHRGGGQRPRARSDRRPRSDRGRRPRPGRARGLTVSARLSPSQARSAAVRCQSRRRPPPRSASPSVPPAPRRSRSGCRAAPRDRSGPAPRRRWRGPAGRA